MRQMKEKLAKNHYKGFDKKLKVTGIVSSVMLFVAICTFVPLTAVLEYENVAGENANNTQTPAQQNVETNSLEVVGE